MLDPVGFLAPFLIRDKVLLQEIWAAGLDWDDLFQGDLARRARAWFSELEDLPEIKVPRCLRLGQDKELLSETLHTFVDVSQDAYGAVIFSKVLFIYLVIYSLFSYLFIIYLFNFIYTRVKTSGLKVNTKIALIILLKY